MKIINEACNRVSEYLAKEIKCSDEKKAVINYGIFAIIQTLICIGLVIIFGLIFNVVTQAIIVSFTISILRKSSGGIHANSPEKCAVIGTVVSIAIAIISTKITMSIIHMIILGVTVFSVSFYLVHKLAPVDTKTKQIKSIIKRKRLRKYSYIILMIYIVIVFLCLYISKAGCNAIFKEYIFCIYGGVLWQVFTLTKTSAVLLKKIL